MAKRNNATKTPAQIQAAQEEKRKKLGVLASKRVGRAISAIRLVGNLGAYKPTVAQMNAISAAITEAHKNAVARLQGSSQAAAGFTLPE